MSELNLQTQREIRCLLAMLLEGELDEAGFARFHLLLRNNDAAQQYYLDLLDVSVSLRKLDWTLEAIGARKADVLDHELWSALSDAEKNAPAVEFNPPACSRPVYVEKLTFPKNERHINRTSLFVVVTSLAAMLLMLAYVYFNPPVSAESVAIMRDSVDAVWGNSSLSSLKPGDLISTRDDVRTLLSGTVKIESLLGPEMIIEGPALFEFPDLNKMILHSGRVYVKVPKTAIGYTVRAPSFSVIDLGTEFGVSVANDGSGDVLMFSGKASLVTGTMGQTRGSQLLTEGSAKRIFAIDQQVQDIPFNPTAFVREMDSRDKMLWRGQAIDLADMVGGGNGLGTGQTGFGIDPVYGLLQAYKVPDLPIQSGSGHYVRTPWTRFVDGIFVPDGGKGPIEVSSEGHVFESCPDTDGVYWVGAVNGGKFMDWANSPQVMLALDGQEYGSTAHPAIFLHTNLGITFNLDAIREAMPSTELKEFRALCGISQSGPGRTPFADFWVLIDGQIKFNQSGTSPGAIRSICLPIEQDDHYLTLMTTDGGRQMCLTVDGTPYPIDSDWCVFAEPRLVLKTQ